MINSNDIQISLLTFSKFLAIMIPCLLLPAYSFSADLYDELPETQWSELIPASWEAPIIEAAPDEHNSLYVDPDSLVDDLQNKTIKLPGFMIPVTVEGFKVTAFILVPFLEQHVKAHIHHDPNQMVYISLKEPLEISNPFQPLWVTGNILLKAVKTDEGPTGYSIENAHAEAYLY